MLVIYQYFLPLFKMSPKNVQILFSVKISVPFLVHPTDLFSRISHNQRVSGNIFREYATGPNHGIFPNRNPAKDSRISADTGAFFDKRWFEFRFPIDKTSRINHISKHATRPQKNIVFANNSRINRYIVLYFYIISQHNSGSDHHILPDITVFAHNGAGHDMRKMPNSASFANHNSFVDYSRRIRLIIRNWSFHKQSVDK